MCSRFDAVPKVSTSRAGVGAMAIPRVAFAPVLSGGFLDRPVVLETTEVGGNHFIRLSKADPQLCRFFAGSRAKLYPLKVVDVFKELMVLRNSASHLGAEQPDLGPGAVDDLGLDMAPPSKAPRRSHSQRDSASPTVSIDFIGGTLRVLRGTGNRDVYVEFTSENMALLHKAVSQEVAAAGSKDAVSAELQVSTELQGASPSTPSGKTTPTETVTPDKVLKGLTWVESRSCWVLRYKDDSDVKRQKRFGVPSRKYDGQVEFDAAKMDAKESALRWAASLADAPRGS